MHEAQERALKLLACREGSPRESSYAGRGITLPGIMTAFAITLLMGFVVQAQAPPSEWVYYGSDGKLAYRTTGDGNTIMDFSWAGYMGGGVTVPVDAVPVKVTISPVSGDNTSNIQNAINEVAAMPLSGGFRGAVLLEPGTYSCSSTIDLNASGVVLRGSGSGTDGSTIEMTGSPHLAISMGGSGTWTIEGSEIPFANAYVPSGTRTVTVTDASSFAAGDNVVIHRIVTAAWVHYLGMDTLVRNGSKETWLSPGTVITTDRTIESISGNTITLDAPLTDSFDPTYLGNPPGTIARYTFGTRISQAGLEHLRILAPIGTDVWSAVAMNSIIDSWMVDVVGQETQNAFDVNDSARRITLDSVINNVSTTQTRSAGTADISITGTQVFVNKCQSNGTGDWPLVTSATGTGPIAVLNFTTTQRAGISPHQRWTTGLLADNASIPNAPSGTQGIAYRNRGTDGSGQGWAIGWAVAWNVTTPYFLVSAAPGSENWCIGCVGAETSTSDPNGIYDSLGTKVTPSSLYLAQMCDRLGAVALTNIGYSSSDCATAPSEDFTIAVSPASQTVTAGSGTSYSVTTTAENGFAGNVALSVSGLPSGATGAFSPASISGSGTSTLTITTTSSAAAGTYTLTITGSSGSLNHTASVKLVVSAPVVTSYEAEASGNTLSGKAAVAACTTCSGGKKVRFIGDGAANYVIINKVSAASAASYTLTVYGVVDGTRSFSVSVNGAAPVTVSCTGTSWEAPVSAPPSVTVTLKAGSTNTIKFYNNSAYAPDLDRITIH